MNAKKSLRILFQGDSITDAFRKPEELNPAYQLGAGYAFLVGADLASRYPGRVELINRGISGHTVQDLLLRWEADAISHRADLVSILAGVNSTIRHFYGEYSDDEPEFLETYSALLTTLIDAHPETKWVLLEPFLLPVGGVTPDWIAHLKDRQKIVRELAEAHGAIWIPLQARFDEACQCAQASWWAYDGIHPTHAGAALIASAWMEKAGPLVKTLLS